MSLFEREPEYFSDDEAVARGQHAQRLLDDPLFAEAYEEAQWELVKQWAHQESNPAKREACWAALQGLDQIHKALRVIVGNGQFAAKQKD